MSESTDVWLEYPADSDGWRARVPLPRVPVAGDVINIDETWPAEGHGEWPEAMVGASYVVRNVQFTIHEPGSHIQTTPVVILKT